MKMRKALSLLLVCGMLLPGMTGCTASAEQRTGEAQGYGGPLTVTVTMNGEDITRVEVTEHSETPGVGTRAIEALPALIAEQDSVEVDTVSGATVTSKAILEAVSMALGQGGGMSPTIPLDGMNASEAPSTRGLTGMGMAATGRIGPGKDEDGGQVYSFNVVFACGEFAKDGTIRALKVDQLEVVTPNLGGGNTFSGFPGSVSNEDRFMKEVAAWQTKGAMREGYMLASGSWREQMDTYEQAMVGMTVEEVMARFGRQGSADADTPAASETDASDASDGGSAQPVTDMADVSMTQSTPAVDGATSATMSLQGEYGDILLAIQRAWEDARQEDGGTKVDTNTVTDATEGESNLG